MPAHLITFTRGEARAILHRLELFDTFAPRLRERAEAMERELRNTGTLILNTDRALNWEILVECIEGSTYHTRHAEPYVNPQAYNGAVRCLWNARAKIAAAFDRDPDSIPFPQV